MARQKRTNKLEPSNPAVELDQAAIDAALAGAVTMADGSHPQVGESLPTMEKEEKPAKESKPTCEDVCDKFAVECENLEIDAKKCYERSAETQDDSIVQFLRTINRKIYNETKNGGFSTNISFRVTTNDWVNVTHIIDWYRSRGFEILNYETTTPPYGNNTGTIQYNFMISWANASH